MAHIINEENLLLSIFVILFPEEKAFFVWKTPAESLKQTYKWHYYYRSSKTKLLFEKARKRGLVPPVYCLETLETTHEKAFLHCIAWTKYFMEKGFSSCCGDFVDKYTEELREETKQIFDSIKEQKLEELCPAGGDLFPDFGQRKQQKQILNSNILNFRTSMEEYEKIKLAAGNTSLTMTEYCKKMVLNGRVIEVDPEVFNDLSRYVNEFVIRDNLLKNILAAIYSTRTYFPTDLAVIQEAIEENSKQQEAAFDSVKQVLKQLLDQ